MRHRLLSLCVTAASLLLAAAARPGVDAGSATPPSGRQASRPPMVAAAPVPALPTADSVAISDSLSLYYVGYRIGREQYTLRSDAGGLHWSADFDYHDRGRRTHLAGDAQLAGDFTPAHMQLRRLGDTTATVTTQVDIDGRDATVTTRGQTNHVALPNTAFALAGTSPTSQHLLLVRYWLAHGRPASLAVVPGGPTNEVNITWRGRDTLALAGKRFVLERYMVNGVVWGRESVWLDAAGRLAFFSTAGGGGLSLEAVRIELEPLYPQLFALSVKDRLADLASITGGIRPVASGTVALTGGTLIDGTARGAIQNATVVVAGGRIVAAGPASEVTIPRGAQRFDATGKTIAPGLWDMHSHLMQIEWMPVYLAAGVTTVRDMGNEIDFIVPLRAAVNAGKGLGPHILLAGLINGGGPNAFGAVNATTPDEGRAAVRRYHDLGFQQMKLYSVLKPDVVGAIIREAHRLNMTVTGHIPTSLTLLAAVDSGMDHIAHLPIRGEADSDSVRHIIAELKAHGTVVDPTASWGELGSHSAAEPVVHLQPGFVHLPPVLAQRIGAMGSATIDTATAHARMARTLHIIRALYQAGVPVVAGTNEGIPGYSVYREVQLYAAAGMTPLDALRAASAVPARAMRLDREVGTLEPGKRADLIVLDGNPLSDIANIGSVQFVMKSGSLYRSAELWSAAGFH